MDDILYAIYNHKHKYGVVGDCYRCAAGREIERLRAVKDAITFYDGDQPRITFDADALRAALAAFSSTPSPTAQAPGRCPDSSSGA